MKQMYSLMILTLMLIGSTAGCNESASESQEQVCGGYTQQREPSEGEVELLKSLAGDLDMTLTPLSVSTQVVAGINYKFWCRYQDKDGSGHCWIFIYKPLPGQGEPGITSIRKEQ